MYVKQLEMIRYHNIFLLEMKKKKILTFLAFRDTFREEMLKAFSPF